MSRLTIAPNIYKDTARDRYLARVQLGNGRYTWRTLKAVGKREAIREGQKKLLAHAEASVSATASPFEPRGDTFATAAAAYLKAGCPNKQGEPRAKTFCATETVCIDHLTSYFGTFTLDKIRLKELMPYAKWRMALCRRAGGHRIVELDWQTLSNVINFSVLQGWSDFNFVRAGRPRLRFHNPQGSRIAIRIRHCREVAPRSADDIHAIANHLFDNIRSETSGWYVLIAPLTGCRKSELLRLRLDARTPEDPGHLSEAHLYIRRSKSGVNPYVALTPDLLELFDCFLYWHGQRYSRNPWFFPGRGLRAARLIEPSSISHAIHAACKSLELPTITPHGLRSYYVTKRRSDGASDELIAREIGDKTVETIRQTYGDIPPDRVKLTWRPSTGLPAWLRWRSQEQKVVAL